MKNKKKQRSTASKKPAVKRAQVAFDTTPAVLITLQKLVGNKKIEAIIKKKATYGRILEYGLQLVYSRHAGK